MASFSTAPGAPAAWPGITGRTRLFPVVGDPVGQVRAPAIFNTLFARAQADALVLPLALPAHCVVQACRALLESSSIGGLLVTVPYKKTLFGLVDRAGRQACQVGAVNAIRRADDGALVGDLFDGLGFVRGLRAAGHDPAGARVLLVGTGGAGSAIAAALMEAGIGALALFDVDRHRALALADTLRRAGLHGPVDVPGTPGAAGCDIVVNATPLGMQPMDALPIDPDTLDAGALVADVIMTPADTRLLQAARERGCRTHAGRPMLDHQVPSYLDFFGLEDVARFQREAA
jgi:shikimate dehydrogenase